MWRLFVLLGIYTGMAIAQSALVSAVKDAVMQGNYALASQEIAQARSVYGDKPEYLEALSWIGRGELRQKHYAAAQKNAEAVHQLCLAQVAHRKLDSDPNLPIALGASIEVIGQSLAGEGNRDQAVVFLRDEVKRWHGTSIADRIQKNLNLLTLEGKPAPMLNYANGIGPTHPQPLSTMHGHPVLLFFWAHWCVDCKAEAASVVKLKATYGPKGLKVIAPTRHYGYVAGGEDAKPEAETHYISEIWTKYYSGIGPVQVPLSDANFQTYGVSTTPTMVIVDKQGIVRLYRPGQVTYDELAAVIAKVL